MGDDKNHLIPQPQLPEYPVCPHCYADPAIVRCANTTFGAMRCMVFFCGNLKCRKIFNVEILGVDQPRIVPSTILPPGRAS